MNHRGLGCRDSGGPIHQHCYAVLMISAALTIFLPRLSSADALGGNISVFADPSGSSCVLLDEKPGFFSVYVVHNNMSNADGFSGSRFSLVEGEGFGATYVGETIAFPGYVGSLRTGITIAYGCLAGSALLATVEYEGHGTSASCSFLDIAKDPGFPIGDTAIAQDCYFYLYPAPSLGKLWVNPAAGQCQPWCVVSTQETTWGKVKALYRH